MKRPWPIMARAFLTKYSEKNHPGVASNSWNFSKRMIQYII